MSEPAETNNPDGAATGNPEGAVLKFKVDGEEKEFDLSNPEHKQELVRLAQYGGGFKQQMQELGATRNEAKQYREAVETWNKLIVDARAGDKEALAKINESLGFELKKEEIDADPALQEIKSLKQQIADIQKGISTNAEAKQIQEIKADLADMEANKKKYPFFNAEQVLQKATELGIRDFDVAYKALYHDKHLELAIKQLKNPNRPFYEGKSKPIVSTPHKYKSMKEVQKNLGKILDEGEYQFLQ
jgi:hypothetical protein